MATAFKNLSLWFAISTAALALACATGRPPRTFGPVGPPPSGSAGTDSPGYLKVYTATKNLREGGMEYRSHTGYAITDPAGKMVKEVANSIGHHDEDPTLIQLPPGAYLVQATADSYGSVRLKVVIQPGQLTKVNLENRPVAPTEYTGHRRALEHLPNGTILGWRTENASTDNTLPSMSNR